MKAWSPAAHMQTDLSSFRHFGVESLHWALNALEVKPGNVTLVWTTLDTLIIRYLSYTVQCGIQRI